jgi:transcriptional regulator GlxA family with amidase domain
VVDFVRKQTPGLQYLLSVCTGSWVLAQAGVLEGKNATTNKAAYKQVEVSTKLCIFHLDAHQSFQAETSKNIHWVPKARWVVDGNTWTSSGVTAGADMGYAFLTHLAGPEFAIKARNTVELRAAAQDDDEFAEIFGLI